ncbi:MAG TPA: polyphosphate kinase 1 [Ktedonobacterales bacterium]
MATRKAAGDEGDEAGTPGVNGTNERGHASARELDAASGPVDNNGRKEPRSRHRKEQRLDQRSDQRLEQRVDHHTGPYAPRVERAPHSGGEGRLKLRRSELYINREVSAMRFIHRVFEEAQAERHPLLERVKFLSFVGSQIDEFLMVRYAGLYEQLKAQVNEVGPDGLLPGQTLERLRPMILDLMRESHLVLRGELLPRLAQAGIEVLEYSRLSKQQSEAAAAYFRSDILPVLTPLGVDPSHPFPHISNRSLNLAVSLRDPVAGDLFARIKVPGTLRRLIPVPLTKGKASEHRDVHSRDQSGMPRYAFVWIEQLIAAHLNLLFPGIEILAAHPFRVLRDADIEIATDEAGDLLSTVEQTLIERRFGATINLTVQPEMPAHVRELLRENLELVSENVFECDAPLGLSDLGELLDLDRPDLKDAPVVARVPVELRRGQDPFAAIRKSDLLLHHPYDAFSSVAEFIDTAARDPQVLAIKQTLYRVGSNSPIVNALLEANARGKQVAVLVELKARFDEENNIEWARMLEHAGVHVVYGLENLKTHAKLALVVRREGTGLQRYAHLGTGNYNASTARTYEDYALLSSRGDLCDDVANLFNALTGFARGVTYKKLLVAPGYMRSGLLERIEREVEAHKKGGQGRLIFKCNALVDPDIIRALYRAAHAGVRIDLLVRGVCSLRPGMLGVSENIRVVSLVGRFLEHSRIYAFANGGLEEPEVLLGSADLMPRNLDHRVEVLFPLEDRSLRSHILGVVLPAYLRDTANASLLLSDGTYEPLRPAKGEPPFDVQAWFAQEHTPVLDREAPYSLQTSPSGATPQ